MSILGTRLPGSRVVDLFAGTGALGLEALSRGAVSADFVEHAAPALALLKRNIETLGVGAQATVIRADALRFATALPPHAYDVALADPPYAGDHAERLIAAFRQVPFADVLAVEHTQTLVLPGDDTRRYGDTAITFCYAP